MHLSEEQIQEAERQLGTRLPEDYREFIRDFSVFSVPTVIFPFKPNDEGHEGGSLEIFNGIVPQTHRYRVFDVVSNYLNTFGAEELEPGWSPDWMSIASDAGTGSVLLAIKGEHRGAVYFLSCYIDAVLIAETFDEFMHLLQNSYEEPEAKEDAESFWTAYLGEA